MVALFLLVTAIGAVGFGQSKKTYALPSDFIGDNDMIYYFSDSSPIFMDIIDQEFHMPVYYDIHSLISSQELAFMLYSDYFWGLEDYAVSSENNCVAIVEIKTLLPDSNVLCNLIDCLQAQGFRVLLVTPYINPLIDACNCANSYLPCEVDKYSRFLRNSVRSMMVDGELLNSFVMVMDGRFIGVDGAGQYGLEQLCSSSVLRRLLMHLNYNCDPYSEMDFGSQLYQNIWGVYRQYFMEPAGYDLNYFGTNTSIEDYIEFWKFVSENEDSLDYADEDYLAEYNAACKEFYLQFYAEALKLQVSDADNPYKDVHILAHADNYLYIDVTDISPETGFAAGYSFANCLQLFAAFDPGVYNICFMGIWQLKSSFYSFIDYMQQAFKDIEDGGQGLGESYANVNTVPFIWEKDEINWGDGIEIMVESEMQDKYGDEYGEPDIEGEFSPSDLELDALFDNFISEMEELIFG